MEYRRLGTSGLEVSVVGLGTNNFGNRFGAQLDEQASIAVVKEAIDQGINMIDTSNTYGNTLSEQYIRKGVKGQRDKVILATKVASVTGDGPNKRGTSRHHIMREVESSLKRLDTDYIDLYYIHFPDPDTPIEETLRALDDLLHQGKVRYISCSNFTPWQVCEAVWTARSLKLDSFVCVQFQYNLLARRIEQEMMPFCQAYGLGIIPYFPLANGFLTGKYRPGQPPPQGTRLEDSRMSPRYLTEENYTFLTRLEDFASERGHTILDLAFCWLLAKPQVASVIAGASKTEQVRSNASSGNAWRLTPEEVQEVDAITAESEFFTPPRGY